MPRSVPTPQRSTGAPAATSSAIRSSSRSPLAAIRVSLMPASSSSRRAARDSSSRSPESSRTPASADAGLARGGDRVAHAVERVVGVDEHHGVLGEVLHEGAERLLLAGERHHVGVGHRPHRPQAVAHRGGDVGGAAAARDRRGASDLHRGVDAVVAARREVEHPLAGPRLAAAGGKHDPGRLGGDHRLEVDLVEQQRLEQLRLDPRRRDPEQRLVGEAHRALGHRLDVAGEAEGGQVVEEVVRESRASAGTRARARRSAAPGPARASARARRRAASRGAAAAAARTARRPPARSGPGAGSWRPSPARTGR